MVLSVCSGVGIFIEEQKKINKNCFILVANFCFKKNFRDVYVANIVYHTNTFISPSAPAEATYPYFGFYDVILLKIIT